MTGLQITDAPWKFVLLGQAPSRHPDPGLPIIGAQAGSRLAAMAGVGFLELIRLAKPVNLMPEWDGTGEDLPHEDATRAADRIAPALAGRRVMILGRAVGRAFGLKREDFLWRGQVRGFTAVLFPHPSAVPRWWGDRMNADRAAATFRLEVNIARKLREGVSRDTGERLPH